jgi:hypothetical protein
MPVMARFSQDAVMGIAIVLCCVLLLFRERWFLAETGKGQRLVQQFGFDLAVWILRGVLLSIAVLGGLLASGIVRPIRW